jgi:hypothetical protein
VSDHPIIVAYGGGTNSTAMLCGFRERGIRPALILFADTGGELPHTYEHLRVMSDKCQEWFGLPIETVFKTYKGEFEGLEGECIRRKQLPSLAYGYKACSLKYKQEPQRKRIRQWMDANGCKTVTQAVGFDFAEGHRATYVASNDLGKGRTATNWFPLIAWQWARKECAEAIARHGLPQPGKSSCFFCPAMKLREILRLRDQVPEYYERAIALEENVKVKGPKQGLSFGVKWSEIVKADDDQLKLFAWLDENDPRHVPCGCYDGEGVSV